MIDLETLKGIAAIVDPFLGGGVVLAYMKARISANASKRSSPSQITESQADLALAVNQQTQTILIENARLRRESNGERRKLQRAVARISAEVAECNGKHQECETRVIALTEKVDRIMKENPPADEYNTIQRVGPKEL